MLWGKENLKCWFYSLLSSQGDLGMPNFGWDRKGTAQRWGLLLKMFLCLIFFLLLYMKLWNHPDFPFQRHTPARVPAAATAGMRGTHDSGLPWDSEGKQSSHFFSLRCLPCQAELWSFIPLEWKASCVAFHQESAPRCIPTKQGTSSPRTE